MFISAHAILKRSQARIERGTRALLGDQAGNAVLEFAFVLMVLLVLGIGVFDFGRYGLLFTRAYSAARAVQNQGVKYGSLPSRRAASAGESSKSCSTPPAQW